MKLTSASRSFRLSNGNDEILTPMPLWAAQIELFRQDIPLYLPQTFFHPAPPDSDCGIARMQ